MARSGICMARLDVEHRVIDASDEFLRRFGRSLGTLKDRSFFDLLHPGVHAPIRRHFDQLAGGHRPRFIEHMAGIGPQGAVFAGELTGVAVCDGTGELAMIVVVVNPERNAPADTVVMGRDIRLLELDARILEGIAAGESTVQIAGRLFLSRQGVDYHVGIMLRKFKVPNRVALVSKAFAMGLLSVASWPPKVLPAHATQANVRTEPRSRRLA